MAAEINQRKNYYSKLKGFLIQLQNTLLGQAADDAALKVQFDAFLPIEKVYDETVCKLRRLLATLPQPSTSGSSGSSSSTSTASSLNVRLPPIDLPHFDGDSADWLPFSDLFKATVDSNSQIAPVQKLQYLKLSLKGEPATLISSIALTDANYTEAWKILQDRYHVEREMVQSLVRRFIRLRPIKSESSTDLRKLIDNANECVRLLEVLKCPINKWDDILVVILEEKLDATARREWAISQKGTARPTFDQFKTFISNHLRGLQASELCSFSQPQPERRKREEGKRQIRAHHTSADQIMCLICNSPHPHHKCSQLLAKTPTERSSTAKQLKLCFNCLSRDHHIRMCPSKSSCRSCGKRHHSLLHVNYQQQPPQSLPTSVPGPSTSGPAQQSPTNIGIHHAGVDTQVLLKTAVVLVEDVWGELQPCRVFLDGGAQGTFISENCIQRLSLPREHSSINIRGFAGTEAGTTRGKANVVIHSRFNANIKASMEALVMSKVTGLLPNFNVKVSTWSHLAGLQLADPDYHTPGPIDILIGADYCAKFMMGGRKEGSPTAPIAQETIFGWVLSGAVPFSAAATLNSYHLEIVNEFNIVRKFWELEEIPRVRVQTVEEKKVEQHFRDHYTRDNTGRFVVGVPFNEKRTGLGLSRTTAVRRLLQVERRLNRQPQHKQTYLEFMREYEDLGHMEKISPPEANEVMGSTFYLPHHFVQNEDSTTTKLRVVFDGSSQTTTGVSLNNALMVGATLQDDLFDLLLRFRLHPIVLKADITKMFRQFRLHQPDSDYHRIIWRENPDQPIQDYRLLTVTYGTACAPHLATRCLQQLGEDSKTKYPAASKALLNDLYVDDLLSGESSVSHAIILYQELSAAVKEAGMELRKWSSNDPTVLASIPPEHRETKPQLLDREQTIKALGVQWIPTSDNFTFTPINFKIDDLTKRSLLSNLARVFDPIGLISAVTVRAKLLLQELWKSGANWDAPVPDHIKQLWAEYAEDLKRVGSLSIPRCITNTEATSYHLHGFADSSEQAYGCVIYLRAVLPDGSIHVSFVTSKTRVAPLRQVTLPRLELCAAVLLSELITRVKECLRLDCDFTLWSDSTITLKWIAAPPRRWKTFVANRVATIQEQTPIECWKHVAGVDNPADLASRGATVTELIDTQFWWKGPTWLSEPELPTFPFPSRTTTVANEEERNKPVLVNHVQLNTSLLQRYSSIIRLRRIIAWMFRFFNNLSSQRPVKRSGPLTPVELQEALLKCIRLQQQQYFQPEITALQTKNEIPRKSSLRSLFPFLDKDGVLRVSGRLTNSNLTEGRKHQIILPSKGHLTTLLINQHHVNNLHGGFQLTWSSLQSEFWILRGRDIVRHLIRSCVTCRRHRATAAEQLMGNLPKSRVTPSRPFLHTGVDYAGPFTLKNPVGVAPKTYKGYICIFVCMSTKAVHLEVVSALSTPAFLASLRRFVSRRGLCAHLYSDCGTNFIGADKELQTFLKSPVHHSRCAEQTSIAGITWHFNPPSAPHHGGLWESAVKSSKFHLRRVVGQAPLTFEAFSTILCQVEAVMNSRPLYAQSNDPTDTIALTPGHFLVGEPLTAVPDVDLTDIQSNRLTQFQLQQQRVQLFWKRWSREYLTTLQQRNKWMWEKENVQVDDLVLLVEDSPPGVWKMGRILSVTPGEDGLVRVVLVRTSTTTLQRPIVKVVPLLKHETS